VGIVFSARAQDYRVSFRLARWAEQVQLFKNELGTFGARFERLSASLLVCRRFLGKRTSLGACAIATVARLSATGQIDEPKAAVNTLGSSGAGVFYEIPLGRSALRLGTELAAQWVRPHYRLTFRQDPRQLDALPFELHRPSRWTASVLASFGVSF